MARQIHELPVWTRFYWNLDGLAATLAAVRHKQGRLLGHMEALAFSLQEEAQLEALTLDVLKSSEIEGENLNADEVRSAVARRLGMDIAGAVPAGREVEGVVETMLDATQNFDKPLTKERLFRWHAALFPTARSDMSKLMVGGWRSEAEGPMQAVSAPAGKEQEAPAASLLDREMSWFMAWVNETGSMDLVFRSALTHLQFVTIHPFDDGNGRIARAIADWFLARSENSAQRFYSLSAQIRQEQKAYYDILERTQKGTLDITPWMEWFLGCLDRAIDATETTLAAVLRKARFWERLADTGINDRQFFVLNRMLGGLEGKLTSTRWASIGNCSHDTALRDIQYLVDKDVLVKNPAGGRSTSYSLKGIEG